MKHLFALIVLLIVVSITLATPGDILLSQALTGQPAEGIRGLAMDWDTGNIWVAGTQSQSNIKYWVFDIGFGYEDSGPDQGWLRYSAVQRRSCADKPE
ncbi:hypothetical protein K8R78_02790 [bacterium]|nr:hypothetical protein [bacterium]